MPKRASIGEGAPKTFCGQTDRGEIAAALDILPSLFFADFYSLQVDKSKIKLTHWVFKRDVTR